VAPKDLAEELHGALNFNLKNRRNQIGYQDHIKVIIIALLPN
jgi:hypothetical protein